jgi:hypothetical protein
VFEKVRAQVPEKRRVPPAVPRAPFVKLANQTCFAKVVPSPIMHLWPGPALLTLCVFVCQNRSHCVGWPEHELEHHPRAYERPTVVALWHYCQDPAHVRALEPQRVLHSQQGCHQVRPCYAPRAPGAVRH